MAVEIPVVVDIEGAFKRAAEQARSTMKPLQKVIDSEPLDVHVRIRNIESANAELRELNQWYRSLEKLQDKIGGKEIDFVPGINRSVMEIRRLDKELDELNVLRQAVGNSDPKLAAEMAKEYNTLINAARQVKTHLHSQEIAEQKLAAVRRVNIGEYANGLSTTNFQLLQMREYYRALEDAAMRSADSINAIRSRISSLNEQWNNFSAAQRKGPEGKSVYNQFKEENKALREQARDLSETLRLEEQRIKLAQTGAQKRRYETAILNSNVKTIRVFQEQQRILTERLNRTPINTKQYREIQTDLARIRAEMERLGVAATNANGALNHQYGVMRRLAAQAGAYVSIWSALRLVKQLRDVTGELEYQRVALNHLIQDEEYGARLYERIKAAAVESPFRINELVTYTKQLSAYQIKQEDLFDTMKRLADVSAGLGVDMNRLILAYGQVRAASVLRGQELRQFTEAGIPLVDLLAQKMGELNNKTYSTAEVFELISKRAVPFSAISSIFEDLTEKGGMFYQMQEEQAKTLIGRWAKLKDVYDIALASIGDTKTFQKQNDVVLAMLRFLAEHLVTIPKLIEGMTTAWLTYSAVSKIIALSNKKVAASNVAVMTSEELKSAKISQSAVKMLGAEKVTKMYAKAQARLAATNSLVSKTMGKLTMAFLKNPYLAIIAALAGVAASLLLFRKRQKEVNDELVKMDDAIDNINKSTKDFNRNESLISSYEKLAAKTERTSAENARLTSTMNRLSEAFPELARKINDENSALDENVRLLKEKNKENKQAAENEARQELVTARGELSSIDKKLKDARLVLSDARVELADLEAKYIGKEGGAEAWEPKTYKRLKKQKEAAQATYDSLEELHNKYVKRIEALERYLYEDVLGEFGATWRNTIKRMQNVEVDGETLNLIDDDEIRKYNSLYDALKKIDKLWKDSTESVKGMKTALKNVDDQYREQAEKEIREEEARARGYKAILDEFGYDASKSQKDAVKDLREELRVVQDIHNRYEKLRKIMGDKRAAEEIKKIYGSVTNIDFLEPNAYKQRLEKILHQINQISNKVKPIKVDLELADSMTDFLLKNEGFLKKATNVEGKGLTLGYGFFKTLPDGRTITEEMTMTEEEGKKLFQLALPRYIEKAQRALETYGEGLQLTKRQFTVLVDLAYQSGSGVQRILKAAKGDAKMIGQLLQDATWKEFAGTKIEAGVKSRDLVRSKIFTSEIPKMLQEGAQSAEATNVDLSELISLETDAEKIVQDVDWDELEKKIKSELSLLAENIRKSKEARDFYNDIFAQTGNQQIAETLTFQIYGNLGKDFKERIQDEMFGALGSVEGIIDPDVFTDLTASITVFDMAEIEKNLNKLPHDVKDVFKNIIAEQKNFEADWFKNFYKTYSKTMSYAERIATVQRQAEKARTEAKERGVGKEGLDAIDTKEKQDIAGIRLEELKNSDEWVLAFENLEKVGKRSLEMLITRISEFIELSGSNLPVDQLRAIKKELEQVQTELEKRDPYRQAIDGIKDYIAALKAMAKARKMSNDDPKKEQALARAENARAKALVKIQNAAQGVGEQLSAMSSALSVFDEFLDLEDTSDAKAVLEGVATGIGILTAALTLLGAVLSFIQAIPIVAVITGIIVALASVAKVIANLKTAKLNRELEAQDAIIKNLERSYKRLSDAIEDAFGSEYIALYQQQLLNLEANEEAIKKKIAALEDARDDAKSGKKEKEYQEQIDGLNDELADVEQSIVDIKKDFQTFFAGTDITSAAKDFAQAWLDAYKSFGSTTAAMKEKFRDMIDNMVVSSLAARIVEGALEPVFNELAKWADEEGKISEEGIASVADVAAAQIDVINNQLGGVMEKLAGLGINMRGTGSTLTGISKDIAGASEESILGLAAGINTQNYYMSYMPTISQNVAAIVTLLGGENAVSQPGTTLPETSTFGDELFRGQMSRIDENLALLVDLVRSVRSVKQSSTNTHVIAVTNN